MIIDAHQHPYWHGHSSDAIVANMDRFGIDRAWLLTWEAAEGEYSPSDVRAFNPRHKEPGLLLDDVLRACERHPGRFVAGFAPDPRLRGSKDRLEAAVDMYGVRIYGEWKFRVLLEDPTCLEMFRLCGRRGLPVVFHMDPPYMPPSDAGSPYEYWYGGTAEDLERTLALCPETTFVAHGPGWWRYISADADERAEVYPDGPVQPGGRAVELMRRYENLFGDLSAGSGRNALGRDTTFALEFIDEFQDRLLFGRDQFDDSLLELLRSLALPDRAMNKILNRNALRLVPLDD